jgi:hypothetical protein
MAVVEISKIQVRRGDARSVGMPQLDTGELGWAITGTDPASTDPELYIGNNTVDGASSTVNTRILTELDLPNIFGSSITTSTFIYDGNQQEAGGTGAIISTGDTGSDIERTVKQKLNDSVTTWDFGVYNEDDSNTTTIGLQRAINMLYLNSDKTSPRSRVTLRMPAGIYGINDTIYLPPYTTLIGDGQNKTIITFIGSGKPIFQFVDGTSTPGSPVTLNSFQSGTSPRNITIKGISLNLSDALSPDSAYPMIYADSPTDTIIDDVGFAGFPTLEYSDNNKNNVGISIRNNGISVRNFRITNCTFDTLHAGIKSDYDIDDAIITNNRFSNLKKGIVFGETLVGDVGPRNCVITRNVFDVIKEEAILITSSNTSNLTNHICSQNIYNTVGNGDYRLNETPYGDLNPSSSATSVIVFDTFGNVSDNEYFSRFSAFNQNVVIDKVFKPLVKGHASIVDNKVRVISIGTSHTSGILAIFPAADPGATNIHLQYQIVSTGAGVTRWGDLHIVVAGGNSINNIVDNYRMAGTSDGGIYFESTYNSTYKNIVIRYYGNTLDGTITYQINQYF